MATNAFSKAINDANISVRLNSDGNRSVGQNAHMDQPFSRGGGNNRSRGRWQRGNRGRGRGRGRGHGNSYNPHSRFNEDEEGDATMDNDRDRSGRYTPYGGGRGGGRRDRSPENRNYNSGEWWRIAIPEGRKHNRDWLMRKLKQMSSEPFCEIDFHNIQDNVVFFVNDKAAADSLRSLSNRITTKDGGKIFLSVKPSRAPKNPGKVGDGSVSNNTTSSSSSSSGNNDEVETIPERLDVLKNCLGNRYNAAEVKLDLSNLYVDKILRAGNIDGKAWVPKLMNTILMIVHDLFPNLKVIDLSNNRIQRLDILKNLSTMCPDLEELNLSQNMIRFTGELSKIKSHKKISKLWFTDNPAHEQFKSDNSAYYSDIRTHLPELKELDGAVLPPSIKFDLQTESSIPPTLGNYFVTEQASKLVMTFLQDFFKVYDSEDRQQLLPAYHSDAVFSMCGNTGVSCNDRNRGNMEIYLKISRNLKRLKDNRNMKSQLIKNKKLPVVAFLVELPQTKHQLDSFTLDVRLVTQACIIFSVQGIFFEGNEKKCRGFSRTFVAVSESNSQLLIINDQLHVRNATENQMEKLKGVPDTIGQSNSSTNQNGSHTLEQQDLLKKFSTESGMNMEWSLGALVSNSWNYEQAATKFTELKQSGQIPPEAFAGRLC